MVEMPLTTAGPRPSGLPWTIVRAGAHLDLYQELLRRSTADLVGC